jgi:hypothetical protein
VDCAGWQRINGTIERHVTRARNATIASLRATRSMAKSGDLSHWSTNSIS